MTRGHSWSTCFKTVNWGRCWKTLVWQWEPRSFFNILLEHIVARVSSDTIAAFDRIIAFVIAIVVMLTSTPDVKWRMPLVFQCTPVSTRLNSSCNFESLFLALESWMYPSERWLHTPDEQWTAYINITVVFRSKFECWSIPSPPPHVGLCLTINLNPISGFKPRCLGCCGRSWRNSTAFTEEWKSGSTSGWNRVEVVQECSIFRAPHCRRY